jgi:hypothetical protein
MKRVRRHVFAFATVLFGVAVVLTTTIGVPVACGALDWTRLAGGWSPLAIVLLCLAFAGLVTFFAGVAWQALTILDPALNTVDSRELAALHRKASQTARSRQLAGEQSTADV